MEKSESNTKGMVILLAVILTAACLGVLVVRYC